MKIRCLLLTGSVAVLQSQLNSSVQVVAAHRLLQDDAGLPPAQDYFIDAMGLVQNTQDAEQQKIKDQAEKIKKEKEEKLSKSKEDYKAAIGKFSRELNKEDFNKAMEMRTNLIENENVAKEELDKVKIDTKNLFQKGFSFAEVARNDYAAEQLEELEIAEKNFNSNLDNVDLLGTFLNTAQSVKSKLQTKYQDQWSDPAQPAEAAPKEDTDE